MPDRPFCSLHCTYDSSNLKSQLNTGPARDLHPQPHLGTRQRFATRGHADYAATYTRDMLDLNMTLPDL